MNKDTGNNKTSFTTKLIETIAPRSHDGEYRINTYSLTLKLNAIYLKGIYLTG
jgi:hypothetical protein